MDIFVRLNLVFFERVGDDPEQKKYGLAVSHFGIIAQSAEILAVSQKWNTGMGAFHHLTDGSQICETWFS